ncbi:HAMP domain-containing protein [Leptospira sp. GIMC2001]|nr:adenylate/guanylate cyclase domain-containing protein [Leptospira sp. GIMC2001]WCL48916.1 HAMP domain-containing protein [Leptospira sp. GIMC2001]
MAIGEDFYAEHKWIEWTILIVFATEYSLRLFSAPSKKEFIFSFNGVIDFLSFAPFIVLIAFDLEAQTYGLRLLRFLRISQSLRLLKYSNLKIRTKIFLAFLVSTLIILVPTLFYVYNYFTNLKEADIRSSLLGHVIVASLQFNAEEILSIKGEEDPKYKSIQNKLIKMKKQLREANIPIRYIYINKKDSIEPTKLVYLVDAEIGDNHSEFGSTWDSVEFNSPWSTDFTKAQTAPEFDFDDDGETLILSAWAPLPTIGVWEEPPVIISMDLLARDVQNAKQTIGFLIIFILSGSVIIISLISIFFASYFNRPIHELIKGIEAFENQDFDYHVKVLSDDELGRLSDLFNKKLFNLMRDFYQFMYAPVAKMLMGPNRQDLIEGKYEHVSVIYTDFKGFSAQSSLYAPRQVVEYLNKSFAVMEKIVTKHKGIIDKHIGDALMVYFIPEPGETNTAKRAVICGIEMQEEYTKLYHELKDQGGLSCLLRIGINSGDAILGAIGSEKLEVTVIGNTVNMANRVESAALPGGIGLSPATATQSQIQYWVGTDCPNWKTRTDITSVKHLENFEVFQIYKDIYLENHE